jgi:hypothetical protein
MLVSIYQIRDITSQKTVIFMGTAMRPSNLTFRTCLQYSLFEAYIQSWGLNCYKQYATQFRGVLNNIDICTMVTDAVTWLIFGTDKSIQKSGCTQSCLLTENTLMIQVT